MSQQLRKANVLVNAFYHIVVANNDGQDFAQAKHNLKTATETIEFPYLLLKKEMKYSVMTIIHAYASDDFSVLIIPGEFKASKMVRKSNTNPTMYIIRGPKHEVTSADITGLSEEMLETLFATSELALAGMLLIEGTIIEKARKEQK